jgi:hypothetical protein
LKDSRLLTDIDASARVDVGRFRPAFGSVQRGSMKQALLLLGFTVVLTVACGGPPVPQDQLTASQAAISAAEVGGVQGDPQAALLVKKAKDQVVEAKKLIEDGNNHRAEMVLLRAEADAQLALAIGQELATRNEAETAEKQVQELRQRQGKK